MRGICYGISIGPGAAGMLTLEAAKIIDEADIVFLPSFPKEDCKAYQVAKKSIPDLDKKDIRCETFSMSRDASVMGQRHEEIFENICPLLEKGKNLAFLTLGEVGLYSTYLYIHDKLVSAGFESKLISGISSVQAITDYLGIPLANGREEVHIFPDTEDLQSRLKLSGTKIFMKPKGDLQKTLAEIAEFVEGSKDSMAYGISNFGMEDEIVARDVSGLSALRGYFTVFIVKNGKNVS